MYKPLSLVLNNSNREFERKPFCTIYSLNPRDRENDQDLRDQSDTHRDHMRDEEAYVAEFEMRDTPAVNAFSPDELLAAASKPRCIKSYRSDRMAIYDEQNDTFHAYSVIEAISQPGLTFQEAVDWVDDRLVLVGNGMRPKNFAVAVSLILGSWAVAIFLISLVVRLFL